MKILIIGIVASGKTTLAKKLSRELNIKHYEIDSIVHDDLNNRKRTGEEQQEIIININKTNDWIIEGTLRKNLYYLLDMADKIIYLDIPLKTRKIRIFTRFIKQKLGLERCNYKPTIKMLKQMCKWTSDFEKERDQREEQLNKYLSKLIRINNLKCGEEYIKNEYSKAQKKH